MGALALFTTVILNQHPIDIDYEIVIAPLRKIHGPLDYLIASSKHQIVDIQPVRDFSLKLDLLLEDLLGVSLYGLSNVLLWMGTSAVLFLLIRSLGAAPYAPWIAVTFLVHPLSAWVVAWPSARKHLLAMFFIALASYFCVLLKQKKLKHPLVIFVCYLLSIFSQPISLLWLVCFFVYFFEEIKRRELLALFYLLSAAFFLTALGNYAYYAYTYPFVTGVPKLVHQTSVDTAIVIAAVSRSFSQIFYPVSFAYDYVKSSPYTLLGLPTLVLFLYGVGRKLPLKTTAFLFALIIFPFVLVYHRPTNIFVSDTYIIIPLFFVLVALSFGLSSLPIKRAMILCWSIIITLFAAKNVWEQRIASDDYDYYRMSYVREPTCRNALPFALLELNRGHDQSFKHITDTAMQSNCILMGKASTALTTRLYFYRVLLDDGLSLKDKWESSRKIKVMTQDLAMVQAILDYLVKGTKFITIHPEILKRIQPTERKLLERAVHQACLTDESCDRKKLINFFKN